MKRKIWKKRGIGILAALTAAFWLILWMSGYGAERPQRQDSVDTAMGTVVSQTLYVRPQAAGEDMPDQSEGETARILKLLGDLEQRELSWRAADSEVAGINARSREAGEQTGSRVQGETTVTVTVSPSMLQLLSRIWQVSEDSGGALDVTLGGLSRLWNLDELAGLTENGITDMDGKQGGETDFGAAGTVLPTRQQIQEALADTGYDRVSLSDGAITLPKGMQLDLGAVGKGIACDRISEYLHDNPRISGAVVAVGGSVITYGQKPDGSPWTVAIVHPRREGQYLGILELDGEHYVSTSGDYERYVTVEDVRYHHILDPSTGYPSRSGLCSVTIVCDSGLLADALSTACFVLGPEQGLALAESYGAEALLAAEDGQLYMTTGMEEIFTAR